MIGKFKNARREGNYVRTIKNVDIPPQEALRHNREESLGRKNTIAVRREAKAGKKRERHNGLRPGKKEGKK